MEQLNEQEKPNNPISEGNTPEGFGMGVNDYFNHYITVADAKAGAFLAANFILFGGLININFCCCIMIPFLLTGVVVISSIVFCCIVLFPRLTKS